jgi:hypothetical protein
MNRTPTRVRAYIDGLNLYHPIAEHAKANPGTEYFKWLNLRKLCETFAPAPHYSIDEVKYFSAFATWLSGPYRRHQVFTSALSSVGVARIMGEFKEKDRQCKRCGTCWTAHEEKESDVAIGAHLVFDAFEDRFDVAMVISGDSDIAPAVRLVRRRFPDKKIWIRIPPSLVGGNELWGAAGGKRNCKRIKWIHIERSVFPAEVRNEQGAIVATCPAQYCYPSWRLAGYRLRPRLSASSMNRSRTSFVIGCFISPRLQRALNDVKPRSMELG